MKQYKHLNYEPNKNMIDENFPATYETAEQKKYKKVEGIEKPIKVIYNVANIGAGFDTETSKKNFPLCALSWVYIWQFAIGDVIYTCRYIEQFKDFIIELNQSLEKRNIYLYVWDANINYENSFIFLLMRELITDCFFKERREPCKIQFDRVILHEVIGIFGCSLADIAKTYTETQKKLGDIDHNLIRNSETPLTDTEMGYIWGDVEILSELTAVAFDLFIRNGNMPMTQTSIVRNAIKKRLGFYKSAQCKKVQPLMPEKFTDYIKHRKYLYSGGLTHSNFKYINQTLQNVKCLDLTSAYPASLNYDYFPDGALHKAESVEEAMMVLNKNAETAKQCYETEVESTPYLMPWFGVVKLTNVEAKTTHTLISKYKCLYLSDDYVLDNNKILKCSECIIMINDVDALCIDDAYYYDDMAFSEFWFFDKYARCPYYLRQVMNEQYKVKCDIKKSGQHKTTMKIGYRRAKEFVNSVYGMCATQVYVNNIVFNAETFELENTGDRDNYLDKKLGITDEDLKGKSIEEKIKIRSEKYGEYYQRVYTAEKAKTFLNPYIAYWCTSYTRKRLCDIIFNPKFSDLICQYDTDSIYYIKKDNYLELEEEIKEINNNLMAYNKRVLKEDYLLDIGIWDEDGEYDEFLPLGSKRYAKRKYYTPEEFDAMDDKQKFDTDIHGNKHIKVNFFYNDNLNLWCEEHITFAGQQEKTLIKNARAEGIDLFIYLKDFNMTAEMSDKKTMTYVDNIIKDIEITDYNGHTCKQNVYGCAVLTDIPFASRVCESSKHLSEYYYMFMSLNSDATNSTVINSIEYNEFKYDEKAYKDDKNYVTVNKDNNTKTSNFTDIEAV